MSGPPPLPQPPRTLPRVRPLAWTADLWRIQNAPELHYRAYPQPRYRFDAPHAEYAAIYACASQVGTFAEVYGERARRLGENDGGRYLLHLAPRTPLPLIDLQDVRLLASLGLDERISVGDDYATCQAWALAFWRAFPAIVGIRYRARKAGAATANVALFADRCADLLAVAPSGGPRRLQELPELVLQAADLYNLVVKFRFQ